MNGKLPGTSPRAFLLVAVLLLAGCGLPSDMGSDGNPRTVSLGDPFVIDEGTRVRLGRDGPRLTFIDVTEESRCPAQAICVWPGRATARFRLEKKTADTTFVIAIPGLVTTPYEIMKGAEVLNFEFKLLDLSPYPTSTKMYSPAYRALLKAGRK